MTFNFTAEGGQQTGFGIPGIQGYGPGGPGSEAPLWSTQTGAGVVNLDGGGSFGDGGGGYTIMVGTNNSGGAQNLALPSSLTVAGGTIYTVINASTGGGADNIQVRDSGGSNVGAAIAPGSADASQGRSFLNTESVDGGSANRWVPFTLQF